MAYITLQAPGLPSRFDFEGTVSRRSKIKAAGGEMVRPVAWNQFVCIDDPDAVDGDRVRTEPAKSNAHRFNGLRVRSPATHKLIQAADGARLLCRNVSLAKGQVLRYACNFLCWGETPYNDFAGFGMVADDPAGYGEPLDVICDMATLHGKGQTSQGWYEHTWRMPHPFRGTLVWIVANGEVVSDPSNFKLSRYAYTNPPALLLDGIRVTGN